MTKNPVQIRSVKTPKGIRFIVTQHGVQVSEPLPRDLAKSLAKSLS